MVKPAYTLHSHNGVLFKKIIIQYGIKATKTKILITERTALHWWGNTGSRFHTSSHGSVTLPGFRGRTTINPEDMEHGNTRRKKQSRSETTHTDH